ncbi:hypothetical protein BDZ97DRAFT_1929982 [Flammula alnicola]|nr:hypothetical protein BDZ97DRAFT_1929982 [Flammula alnicola]
MSRIHDVSLAVRKRLYAELEGDCGDGEAFNFEEVDATSDSSDGEVPAKGKIPKIAGKAAKGTLRRFKTVERIHAGEDGGRESKPSLPPKTSDVIILGETMSLVHAQPEENGHRAPPTKAKDAKTAKLTVQQPWPSLLPRPVGTEMA